MLTCHLNIFFAEVTIRYFPRFSYSGCPFFYCLVLTGFFLLLYILNSSPLSDVFFCKYFLPVDGLSSHVLHNVFCRAIFNFDESNLSFFFMDHVFCLVSKKSSEYLKSSKCSPVLPSGGFILLSFTFRSVIHFELIFMKCLKSVLIYFSHVDIHLFQHHC